MSYLICHNSEPCQEILSVLPPTYDDHFELLWVEGEHSKVHQSVLSAIHDKKKQAGTQPNKLLVPTVMFYDEPTQTYTRYDGVKAVQFLHNYTLSTYKNRLEKQRVNTASNTPILQQSNVNLGRILDIHGITTQNAPASSIKQIIQDTTKFELQHMYDKMKSAHIPMSTIHK
jgi:hypothetical protein